MVWVLCRTTAITPIISRWRNSGSQVCSCAGRWTDDWPYNKQTWGEWEECFSMTCLSSEYDPPRDWDVMDTKQSHFVVHVVSFLLNQIVGCSAVWGRFLQKRFWLNSRIAHRCARPVIYWQAGCIPQRPIDTNYMHADASACMRWYLVCTRAGWCICK